MLVFTDSKVFIMRGKYSHNYRVTVKEVRIARIKVLEAIIKGGDDVACLARDYCTLCEAYLWQNADRVMPKY